MYYERFTSLVVVSLLLRIRRKSSQTLGTRLLQQMLTRVVIGLPLRSWVPLPSKISAESPRLPQMRTGWGMNVQ